MSTKIVKLEAQNVKRLHAVEIIPDSNTVVIGGKNGQGKSSVLDSIMYAMGGKDTICEKPLRDGEERGMVRVELDDLIVIRTFTASGGGTLTVTNHEGAKYASPQAMLDKLVGTLTFDPLAFTRMVPKQQLETLRNLVGIDFSVLEAERKKAFDERTIINRGVASLEGQLQGMQHHPDAPAKELAITDLVDQMRAAEQQNAKHAEFIRAEQYGKEKMAAIAREIAQLSAKIQSLQEENDRVYADVQKAIDGAGAITLVNLEPLRNAIATAEQTNAAVRQNEQYSETKANLEQRKEAVKLLTDAITSVDEKKKAALAAAKFPVDGLSFNENGVLLKGLPFSQASSAEQMRVSVAMGIAMNPKLKVMMIRDGSLLDDDSLKMIAEFAAEHDYQIWIERVGDGKEVSVVIEDGQVKQRKEAAA